MNWIKNNKEWIFSGIGVFILSSIPTWIKNLLPERAKTWVEQNWLVFVLIIVIFILVTYIIWSRKGKNESIPKEKIQKDNILNYEPHFSFEELKKKISIIVIDDDKTFPTKGFLDYGYSIIELKKLKNERELRDLLENKYDVIVLDYFDIALDLSHEDGIGILKSIKENNPSQIVIAYSNQEFDVSKSIFWDLSDDKLGKPTPFVPTEEKIRNLILQKFTLKFYRDKIESTLSDCKEFQLFEKIEAILLEAITKNKVPNWNRDFSFIPTDKNCRTKIINISKSVLKFLNIS